MLDWLIRHGYVRDTRGERWAFWYVLVMLIVSWTYAGVMFVRCGGLK